MLKPNEKLTLSPKECAEYTHIGVNRLYEIAAENPTLDWILKVGAHLKIKRPLFERWLDNESYI